MLPTKTPCHVVIIPDGNRRWAKERSLPSLLGHKEGYKMAKEIIKEAKEQGVKFLTLWAFSTENWLRGKQEVSDLLFVILQGLEDLYTHVHENKIRFVHLGRKDRLTEEIVSLIEKLEKETLLYESFCLSVAIDYGGEDEINRATEKMFAFGTPHPPLKDFLDTSLFGIPDPDCIIRTSGEQRTSGCMPLQSVYSEWFFEKVSFPDFTVEIFRKCLLEYSRRTRRFGK